jgi:arylsulfatase A-like enzyme
MPSLPRRLGSGWALGLWSGALGGALAGLTEGVAAWNAAAQYLPGAGGRFVLILFLIAIEGLFGALLGCLAGVVLSLLWFGSDLHILLPPIWKRGGSGLFAWSIAALLALVAAIASITTLALYAQLHFHNRALIAKWIGVLSPLIMVGIAAAAFPVQKAVRSLAVRFTWTASRMAAVLALAAAAAIAIVAALVANRETVQVVDLRPFIAGGAFAIGSIGSAVLAKRPPLARRKLAGRIAHAGLIVVAIVLTIATGSSDGVRKSAALHTAFGGPLTTTLRNTVDFDRDGYSPILGGGDCNDFDSEIHPGAFDWPDNGKDEDCSGSDATLKTEPPPPFVAVPDSVPKDPDILLITIDTLRADHLGTYGYSRPTSPNIDALAQKSVVFDHGYAHAPSTRYSMPVILTGRYASQVDWDSACPFTGGCPTRWPPPLAQSNVTLAEMLKKYGYYTAALLNYRFFDRGMGYDQGFDLYDNGRSVLHQGATDPATHGSSSKQQADVAIDFLRQHAQQKFFLWVHFYDPHYYYEDHPEFPPFGTSDMDRYDGEIRFTDLHVGRLLDALKELGLSEKTIVVVTGDHGEGFGEHGIPHHGYHLYNAQTQVPMIFRVPGIAPHRANEPVGHVDMIPTLLNLLRVQTEPSLVGRTTVDLMLGQATPRHIFQEVMYEGPVTRKTIVTRDWKLIWNVVPDNTFELYEIGKDPGETHDRFSDGSVREVVDDLKKKLTAWVERSTLPPGFSEKVIRAVSENEPDSKQPVHAMLGDAVELVGYRLASSVVQPGGVIDITYIWHARKRLTGAWRPFVHVEGQNGIWVNADHVPVDGLFPIDRWKPGQYISDHQTIQVPSLARGALTIWVGLFEGGKRLPIHGGQTDASGRLRLTTVQVTP